MGKILLPPIENLIPLSSAAGLAGVSERTVRRCIEDGRLQGYKLAGTRILRVDKVEVDGLFGPSMA